MRPRTLSIALWLVVALLAAACSGDDSSDGTEADVGSDTTTAPTDSDTTDTTSDDEGGDEELTLLIHPTLYAATGGDGGMVDEYEEATGVDVEVVTAGVNEYIAAAMVEFAAGSGRFDVIAMENSHITELVVPGLLDLSSYVEAAPDEWDYDGFPESLKGPVTLDDGSVIGIPYRFAGQGFYYRTDLFEQAGVEPPATFDEWLTVAETVKAETGVTPIVQRGVGEEIVHDWLNFLYGHGGHVLTDDFSACAVNSAEGVAAAEFYRHLLANELVPVDLLSLGRDDYIARMQSGDVTSGVYYAPYWGRLVDEAESTVSDQMSYALPPTAAGVEPGKARAAGWYLSVAADTQHPDASWNLVQHITSPENDLRGAIEFANAPVRASTYEDPTFLDAFPLAGAWSDALGVAEVDPAVPGMPEIVDILSEHLASIVQGDVSAQDGLDTACESIQSVLG